MHCIRLILALSLCFPICRLEAQLAAPSAASVLPKTQTAAGDSSLVKLFGLPKTSNSGNSLCPAPDGGFYWAITLDDSLAYGKITADGKLLYLNKIVGLTGFLSFISDLVVDSEGMLAGCGNVSVGPTPGDVAFAFRIDPSTNKLLWMKTWQGVAYVNGMVDLEAEDRYLIYDNPHFQGGDDARFIYLERQTGGLLGGATKQYHLGTSESFDEVIPFQGSLYAVGRFTNGGDFTNMRTTVARLNTAGIPTWIYLGPVAPATPARLYGRSMVIDQGGLVSVSFGNPTGADLDSSNLYIQKNSIQGGNLLWVKRFDLKDFSGEQVEKVVATEDGYIMLGRGRKTGFLLKLFLLKTGKDGNLQWARELNLGGSSTLYYPNASQDQLVSSGNYVYGTAGHAQVDDKFGFPIIWFRIPGKGTPGPECPVLQPISVDVIPVINPTQLDMSSQVSVFPGNILYSNSPGSIVFAGTLADSIVCSTVKVNCDTLNLGPDVVVCKDTTLLLSAGSGFVNYLWQDGSTSSTFQATKPGLYSVTVTDACGKIQADSILISPSLINDTQFKDETICEGSSVTLSAPGFAVYSWAPNIGLSCTNCATVTITPPTTTSYTFFATNADGCSHRDTFLLQVLPVPPLDLGADKKICKDTSIVLSAGSGFSKYLWQDGSVSSSFTATKPGLYSVTVTHACGKIQTDSILISPSLINDTQFPDQKLCAGASINLSITGFETYSWSPAAGLSCTSCSTVTITPTATTLYTFKGTNSDGCNHADTFLITVIQQISSTDTLTGCAGDTLVVGGKAYTQNTEVTQTLKNVDGCDSLATHIVRFNPLPQRTDTFYLVPGYPVVINGNAYSQPATVKLTLPAKGSGCDTLATYVILNSPQGDYCDRKIIGCIKYELLDICRTPAGDKTYRMRVTNNCKEDIVYVLFQLPDGTVGVGPANGSVYHAPSGRNYAIRNPHYTPFYSIRFKAQTGGLKNGLADIFEYTIQEQSEPLFIHAMVKLENDVYWETHLNTFYCDIKPCAGKKTQQLLKNNLVWLNPNPSEGRIVIHTETSEYNSLQLQAFNQQGQIVFETAIPSGLDTFELQLPDTLPNGLYWISLTAPGMERRMTKLILQR